MTLTKKMNKSSVQSCGIDDFISPTHRFYILIFSKDIKEHKNKNKKTAKYFPINVLVILPSTKIAIILLFLLSLFYLSRELYVLAT